MSEDCHLSPSLVLVGRIGAGTRERPPLAETERWKRKGSLTADLGKITAEAAGLKKECVRQNLFGLNYLWLPHHFYFCEYIFYFQSAFTLSRKAQSFSLYVFHLLSRDYHIHNTSDTSGHQMCRFFPLPQAVLRYYLGVLQFNLFW